MSVSRAFSTFPSGVLSKGALPPGSLHRAPTEREREREREREILTPTLEPLSTISQSSR
jgi:hypothetical protein